MSKSGLAGDRREHDSKIQILLHHRTIFLDFPLGNPDATNFVKLDFGENRKAIPDFLESKNSPGSKNLYVVGFLP